MILLYVCIFCDINRHVHRLLQNKKIQPGILKNINLDMIWELYIQTLTYIMMLGFNKHCKGDTVCRDPPLNMTGKIT